ncbi:MAG: GDP-L-fucose synthase [Bacteroidales bacterium]|nr:GDP-L-fucose synthase [Bacteroidales bacterium]
MNKDARIYIAGHLGMVGSAILRNLQEKGYGNFILRTLDELDLSRQEETEKFFNHEKPDYVIDAAAKVGGIVANNTYRAQFIYENLMIQNNIIHSAYLTGVKKLLFLGSSCIYPRLAPQPLREEYLLTGELEPTNEPYAIAKITGIKMCESYYRQYGCNFISVMPTNLYGPNDNFNLETSHVLPALIRKFHLGKCLDQADWKAIRADLEKRPVEGIDGKADESVILAILNKYGICRENGKTSIALWGTGNPLREFMHVDDMAAACVFIMENIDAARLYQDIGLSHINIGVGEDISIAGIAGLVKSITAYAGEVQYDKDKPDGTPRKLMDVSLLKSLGYSPAIGLEEGLREVYVNYQKF